MHFANRRSRLIGTLATITAMAACANPAAAENETLTDAGDILQWALPAAGGAATLFERNNWEGTKMWAKSTGAAMATQVVIKEVVDKTRPNNGNLSFPSGHTTGAFSGAAFIQRRYGWGWGVPAYALAGLTGYSRIDSNHHDIMDVVAGATIGTMSAYIFTEPFKIAGHPVSIRPGYNDGLYSLRFNLLDPDAKRDRVKMGNYRQSSFMSWFSNGGVAAEDGGLWIGTDPTQTVSNVDLRMEFFDQSLNTNRNDSRVTAYVPRLRGEWAFNRNMKIGAEIGYAWNDELPSYSHGFGDTEVNYLWRYYENTPSKWWCSRAAAFGLDLLIPTGSGKKGTGSDTWMIRPKFTGAWSPTDNVNLYPTLSYYQSLSTGDYAGGETSAASLEFMMEYKFDNGFYAHWRPDFIYQFKSLPGADDFVANHTFEAGMPICGSSTVAYLRYELISNSLYKVAPPTTNRPRFYDDVVSVGIRHSFSERT